MRIAIVSVLIFSGCALAPITRPEYELTDSKAGGRLTWCGHTAVELNEQNPKDDHIVDDVQARAFDLGLSWNTEPDGKTGEMLQAKYFWRIPKIHLAGSHYMVSVERTSSSEIIFTLQGKNDGTEILKSPICHLEKGFFVKIEDIEHHLNKVPPEVIDSWKKNEPNKTPERNR